MNIHIYIYTILFFDNYIYIRFWMWDFKAINIWRKTGDKTNKNSFKLKNGFQKSSIFLGTHQNFRKMPYKCLQSSFFFLPLKLWLIYTDHILYTMRPQNCLNIYTYTHICVYVFNCLFFIFIMCLFDSPYSLIFKKNWIYNK